MRAYHNCTTAAAPFRNTFAHVRAPLALVWTDAVKATYALQVAQNNLAALGASYAAACAFLGEANRKPKALRRHWQAKAFRAINAARRQLRKGREALSAAMENPALVSDQVAA